MSANPQSVAYGSHGRGIPLGINLVLAVLYVAVNLYQFVFLPLLLLPSSLAWAWTLLPLALLTNPYWSLIHEAIHDLFHPNRNVNAFFGRFLSILFGAPFRILRMSHLVHHKLNRRPIEGTEYYDRAKGTRAGAAPGYFFQIFLGLYLVEVLSPLYFLLPQTLPHVGAEAIYATRRRQRSVDAELVGRRSLARDTLRWIADGFVADLVFSLLRRAAGRCSLLCCSRVAF